MVFENANIFKIYTGTSIPEVDNCPAASRIDWMIGDFANCLLLGG
jgi:hypothetical protein